MSPQQPLILASSSKYRQGLMQKLGLKFDSIAPDIDETPENDEGPAALVSRLAKQKALAVAEKHPNALIIASDQVACLNDSILTKPYTVKNALAQLARCSGKTVKFYTSLAVYNGLAETMDIIVEPYIVGFKTLTDEQIAFYVEQEKPLDCAGSFKCEGLGIALFSSLDGKDFNTLIGLPLIELTRLLAKNGIDVLKYAATNPKDAQ